jgi:hypothetical protein
VSRFSNPRPRASARAGLYLGVVCLMLMAQSEGCAVFSRLGGAKRSSPATVPAATPPEVTPQGATPAESPPTVEPAPVGTSTAAKTPSHRSTSGTDTTGSRKSAAGTPIAGAAATPPLEPASSDTQTAGSPATPTLSVDLPPAERARLVEAARRDREDTESLLKAIKVDTLPPDGQERLRTIQGLLDDSAEAANRGDLQAAASLVHKARLLAEELSGR